MKDFIILTLIACLFSAFMMMCIYHGLRNYAPQETMMINEFDNYGE